jgi:cyclophilin family peptidyl-prolyl cis-trans isomerase
MVAKKNNISRKRSRPISPKKTIPNLKIIGILLVILIIIIFSAVYIFLGSDSENNNNLIEDENPIAVINTSKGIIKVELFVDQVPNTCDNFIKLVNDGFYNGLIFHRISDNFMIQGGLMYPDGSTKESPYGPIDLEINPEVRHVDGAISMARTTDPNSATSQFFICDGAQPGLDDSYAVFGVTISGIDVVRNIASQPQDNSSPAGGGKPLEDIIINSITIENQ